MHISKVLEKTSLKPEEIDSIYTRITKGYLPTEADVNTMNAIEDKIGEGKAINSADLGHIIALAEVGNHRALAVKNRIPKDVLEKQLAKIQGKISAPGGMIATTSRDSIPSVPKSLTR